MGAKGQSTSVQNTSQSWAPSSEVMSAYQNLLDQISSVGNTPYQAYTGNTVAGFTGDQTQAQQQIRDAQGVYQPYLDQASAAAAMGVTPTYQTVSQYMSPYTQSVVDATRANLNQNNAIQQNQLRGNAALQGALGGDRVGVAQAELARNQDLADNQTIANLYNQGYTTALGAAQSDKSSALSASNLYNQLGTSAQGLALNQANALNSSGAQQQQLNQAGLNWNLNQFNEQRAYPYQQLQYLAGLTTGVGSQMGGTSTGTGTSTTTPAQPNPWTQAIGLGLTAASLFKDGGRVPFAEGGLAMPYAGGYVPSVGLSAKPFQPPAPMQMGGGGQGGQQPASGAGSIVNQALGLAGKIRDNMKSQPIDISAPGLSTPFTPFGGVTTAGVDPTGGLGGIYAHGGKVLDMKRDPRGIYVPRGFAGGGAPSFDDAWSGGSFDYGTGAGTPTFADRWAPVPPAIADGTFDPRADNYTSGLGPAVSGAPGTGPAMLPAPAPANGVAAINRAIRPPAPDNEPEPLAYAPPDLTGRVPSGLNPTGGLGEAATPQAQSLLGRAFGLSPEANQGLMAAGLGMMASRSPWLGVGLGEGGAHGLSVYAEAKKLTEAAARAREQLAETRRWHDVSDTRQREINEENVAQRREAAKERAETLRILEGRRSEDRRYGADTRAETARDVAGTRAGAARDIEDVRSGDRRYGVDNRTDTTREGIEQRREAEKQRSEDRRYGIDRRGPSAGASGQTERIIAELRKERPDLTYAEALALAKRAPNGDAATLRRESLALQAAKADLGYMTNPDATIEKYRQKYGLGSAGPAPSPAPSAPAKPAAPSAGAPAATAKPAESGGLKPVPDDTLAKARDAIAKGAPKDAVIKRLRDAGFDPGGL